MERGILLHSWLEHAHGRFTPCSPDDLPIPGEGVGPVAERLGWSTEQYAALRPFLLAHQRGCPLASDDLLDVLPERSLTAWDTDANIVITTRADLVLSTPAGPVVRETKSLGDAPGEESTAELLERYPQVAVTLCLLADGLEPASGEVVVGAPRGVVQLEVLWPGGQAVHTFDAADAETVLIARGLVADAVDTIIYAEPTPHVGRWCAWCPVSRWCTARQGGSASGGQAVDSGEVVDDAPGAQPSRITLLAYAEDASTVEEDVPF